MTDIRPPAACWRPVLSLVGAAALLVLAWVVMTRDGDSTQGSDLETTSAPPSSAWQAPTLEGRPQGGEGEESATSPTTPATAEGLSHGPVTLVVDTPSPVRVLLGVLGGARDGDIISAVARERGFDLPEMPYDGSVRLALLSPRRARSQPILAVVTGPRLVMPDPGALLICDVLAIDVDTGAQIAGVRLDADSDRELPTSVVVVGLLERRFGLRLPPLPPPGWAVFPGPRVDHVPSLRASRLLLHLPMTREADVVAEAGPGGTRGRGELRVVAAEIGGQGVSGLSSQVAGPDMVRLHGVPWLPGEPLRVLLGAGSPRPVPDELGDDSVDLGDDYWAEVAPEARIWSRDTWYDVTEPNVATDPALLAVGVERLSDGRAQGTRVVGTFDPDSPIARVGVVEVDQDVSSEEVSVPGWAPGFGAVEVVVLDRSGGPLPFVRVECAGVTRIADEQGRCRFERVPPQLQPLALVEPGWILTRTHVQVRKDEVVDIELREQEGGRIVFKVQDEQGRPLSAADIRVPDGAAWADVDSDGVQRLDIRTDFRGTRVLERFPVGRWQFEVAYGLRRATASVTVTTGATTLVELTLPPVPDPAPSTDD